MADASVWNESWGSIDWKDDSADEVFRKVSDLIEKGFGVNMENPNGKVTPIMNAAFIGNLAVVNLLLAKNADVNVKNEMGYTPLMAAVINGHKEIAEKLLDAGADMNVKSPNNATVFDMARKYQKPDIEKLLTAKANLTGVKKANQKVR